MVVTQTVVVIQAVVGTQVHPVAASLPHGLSDHHGLSDYHGWRELMLMLELSVCPCRGLRDHRRWCPCHEQVLPWAVHWHDWY